MNKQEVLQRCIIEDKVVKLPDIQLDGKLYLEVKKALELIGGKWKGGKVYGFIFQSDPTDLLSQIASGENRNLKKEFQFFVTPSHLADQLVELAEVNDTQMILEPSAGQGAIIEAIERRLGSGKGNIVAIELMDVNCAILNQKGYHVEQEDFLSTPNQPIYDRIIANPPFSKNRDIDHIRRMYECLKDGGRIVSVASNHWKDSTNKKEVEFRNWLNEIGAEIKNIPSGTFKESGTNISACIIIINK